MNDKKTDLNVYDYLTPLTIPNCDFDLSAIIKQMKNLGKKVKMSTMGSLEVQFEKITENGGLKRGESMLFCALYSDRHKSAINKEIIMKIIKARKSCESKSDMKIEYLPLTDGMSRHFDNENNDKE